VAVGFTVTLPADARSPFTPEIVTSVAFWVAHVRTVEAPAETVSGFAVNELITGAAAGGLGETVTAAVAVVVPPGPVAVRVYDVLSVGFTVTDPETGKVPVMPEMLTDVAFVVAQLKVALSPITMFAGFTVKLVTTGTGVITPPPSSPPLLDPQEINPRLAVRTVITTSRRRVTCMIPSK
jgi:hypothetical protein